MTSSPNVAVVVGNPKPASRTLHAAVRVAEQLSGTRPATVIDLATLGPALLDPADPAVNSLVESVRRSSLVVVASPTYKATYTGLLKLFLDRFPTDSLAGVVAIPVMLGAGLRHALAPEVFLRPVLAELGATLPTRALYLLEQDYDQPSEYEPWLTETRRQLTGAADVFAGSLR